MLYGYLRDDYVGCGSVDLRMDGIHGGDVYRNNVDLDFSVNINPVGIKSEIINRINVKTEFCERYPDERQEKLRKAIAERENVDVTEVVCGNGASELFLAIAHAFRPKEVLLPIPSFLGYERMVKAVGASPIFFPLQEDRGFLMDEIWVDKFEEYLVAVSKDGQIDRDIVLKQESIDGCEGKVDSSFRRVLVLTNPNNPTGRLIPKNILKRMLNICLKVHILVVLDECFIEFIKEYHEKTMVKELEQYPNLIIVRAFTKYFAMPGLRLGYLMCFDRWIVNKIKIQLPEWNVSLLAQEAGVAALEQEADYEKTSELIERERQFLVERISYVFAEKQEEVCIIPSDANFILFRTRLPLYDLLLRKGILIRDCSNYRGLENCYYRIAVRTHEENRYLLEVLNHIWDDNT